MTSLSSYVSEPGASRLDHGNGHENLSGSPQPAGAVAGASAPELLEQLREDALRFLARTRYPPRALRIQVGDVSLELEWQPAGTDSSGAPPAEGWPGSGTGSEPERPDSPPPGHSLRAPSVGVFYRSPAPGEAAFVDVGDAVRAGQQVGIVEVMKLMIPVNADRDGTVAEVLKGDGDSVEYDEPLITLALAPG